MTKRVVGDEVQEDTVTTYSRADVEHQIAKCEAELPRWERQLGVTQDAITKNKADHAEWTRLLAALPTPPAPEPAPDPVAETPGLVG